MKYSAVYRGGVVASIPPPSPTKAISQRAVLDGRSYAFCPEQGSTTRAEDVGLGLVQHRKRRSS